MGDVLVAAQAPEEVESIDERHPQVEENRVRAKRGRFPKAGLGVAGAPNRKTF